MLLAFSQACRGTYRLAEEGAGDHFFEVLATTSARGILQACELCLKPGSLGRDARSTLHQTAISLTNERMESNEPCQLL